MHEVTVFRKSLANASDDPAFDFRDMYANFKENTDL